MDKKILHKRVLSLAFLFLIILVVPDKLYSAKVEVTVAKGDSTNLQKVKSSLLRPHAKSILISASPISDQEAIDYIRDVWDLTDYTDETIRELLPTDYQGIPFKEWISFFIEVPSILNPLRNGDYVEASKQGARVASKGLINFALSKVGLSGVASIAGLASLPIKLGISAFEDAANSNAFEIQRQYYFEARKFNDFETILNAEPFELIDAENIPISKDGEGWFFRQNGFGSQAPAVPDFTAEQFIRLAELQWQAERGTGLNYESDNDQVRNAFRSDAEGGGGSEQPPADEQTIARIDVEGNDGYQSVPVSVSLDGSQSVSPEEIVSYEWDLGDGNTATGETVDHVFYTAGKNTVRLTITNASGTEDQVTRDIYFSAPTFSVTPQTLHTSRFKAQAAGNVTGYSWDFGDGSTTSGREVEHTFDIDGEYIVELTLTFSGGGTTTVSKKIYAGPRPIYVSGTIENDRRWAAAYGPYVVKDYLKVEKGVTLTIDPGVVVKFIRDTYANGDPAPELRVEGSLKAEGTVQDSIIFTSLRDDTHGGDTNGDGDSTVARAGDWRTINFYKAENSVIDYAVMRYGGIRRNTGAYAREDSSRVGIVDVNYTPVSITNSRFSDSYGDGINIQGSTENPIATAINNNQFSYNQRAGLKVRDASPTVKGNVFIKNNIGIKLSGKTNFDLGTKAKHGKNQFFYNYAFAIENSSSDTVQAVGNYWNSTDANVIDSRIYDDDESNAGPVIFEPFLDEAPEGGDTDSDVPTITGVVPNPVTGSNSDQPLTVNGSGFKDGAIVVLDDLDDEQGPFENPSKTTFVSSTELSRQATFTENAATWSALVENPDGTRSDTVHFEVKAPSGSGEIIAPPTSLRASQDNGNIVLSWEANTEGDLAGYNLYRATDSFSEVSEATIINGSELIKGENYMDSNVEAETAYYYRLTAVDTEDNESGLSEEVQETLEGEDVPLATPNMLEALIWTQEALTGGYTPDNYKFNELKLEYDKGIKHLAYLSAGKFVFGFGIYIDADDYAGITGEGRSLNGGKDGWVTVWIDGSIGIEAALPAFGGMTKIKFDKNSPDPLRDFQLSKPGVEASAINIEFLNYEEGRGFLGYNAGFEPTAAFEASIALAGVGTNLSRFEMKRSALDDIVNQIVNLNSGKVVSLDKEKLRETYIEFVTAGDLGSVGEVLYPIRKAFDSSSYREFTFTDTEDEDRPKVAAYIESAGGGIDSNLDGIPDNVTPVNEIENRIIPWGFLLNVRGIGTQDERYVVEANAPEGWNINNAKDVFLRTNSVTTAPIPPGEIETTHWAISIGPEATNDEAKVTFTIRPSFEERILDEVTITFKRYKGELLVYNGRSPVELNVKTPSGKTINFDNYDAAQTMYNQFDIDGSGDEDAQVIITSPEKGIHKIEVVANEDAKPEDTYTLEAIENSTVNVITEDTFIKDIPENSYSYAADIEPPLTPSNFILKTGGATTTVEWKKNSEEFLEGYFLYSGKDPNALTILDTLATNTTSYAVSSSGVNYYSLSAFDINGNESPLSPWVSFVNDQLNISTQWQMVSNPAIAAKNISEANIFRFEGTYKADSVLTAGTGYWVKSETNKGVPLQDRGIDSTQIQLNKGWNLIGSLVDTLNKSAITDPNSIIGSAPVYGYDVKKSDYEKTSELLPMQGYWLFADQSGTITLNFDTQSSTPKNAANPANKISENDRLIFSNDTAERNIVYFYSTLGEEDRQQYLLPPVAPAAVMDVRTPSGYKAVDSGSGEINLTAQRYPVQIRLEGQSEGGFVYQIIATDDEKKKKLILTAALPVILDQEYETIKVTRLSEDEIILENDLDPNFPNPFSSTTQIVYRLAQTSQVTLTVYDVIGRKVETLVDEEQTTGEYPVTFDGSGLASGIYIILLKLDDDVKDQKITLIK